MTWSSLAWAPPGFPSRRAARRLDGIRRGRCEAGRRIHAGDRGLRDPLQRGQQPRHRHQGPRPRRHGLHDQRQVRHPLHRRLRLHLRPSLRRLCGGLRQRSVIGDESRHREPTPPGGAHIHKGFQQQRAVGSPFLRAVPAVRCFVHKTIRRQKPADRQGSVNSPERPS